MKNALLAVLIPGPAYGLQMRGELLRRIPRERPINVGQVYATIERLVRDGKLVQSAWTPDGLPLYSLTETGRATAMRWLSTPVRETRHPWETMTTQVLLAQSLPGVDPEPLMTAYENFWRQYERHGLAEREAGKRQPLDASARSMIALAAAGWLQYAREHPVEPYEHSKERPQRGRPRLDQTRDSR